MTRVIVHVVAFIGAVIAAAVLHMLGRDVFGLSSEMMLTNSLVSAVLLGMACAFYALAKASK